MLSLLSCGSNAQGQLGNASEQDSQTFRTSSFAGYATGTLPAGITRILDIATGANHTLLLLEAVGNKRELWGCGDGRRGQLGLYYQREIAEGHPTTLFRKLDLSLEASGLGSYSFKFISATWETSYVVLYCEGKEDVVISMGSDDYGDLGIGGLKTKASPKDFHVVSFHHLPAFSQNFKVQAIHSGQRHVVLQVRFGISTTLIGWGASRHGQLGDLATKPFASSPQVVITNSNQTTTTNDVLSRVSLGIQHSIVVPASGPLASLGSNRKGQMEVVKTLVSDQAHILDVDCTWNGTYAVLETEGGWAIYSSGSNSHSQLGWTSDGNAVVDRVAFPGTLDVLTTSIQLACGSEHILALVTPTCTSQGFEHQAPQVWGWGWNEHGNLGVGTTDDVTIPTKIWPPSSSDGGAYNVRGIWAGLGTSWICFDIPSDLH